MKTIHEQHFFIIKEDSGVCIVKITSAFKSSTLQGDKGAFLNLSGASRFTEHLLPSKRSRILLNVRFCRYLLNLKREN